MKKAILLFIVSTMTILFVNAQTNPLGLAFDGTPTLSYCSVNDRPICKMKVKIMTPPVGGGGSLHISATLDGAFPAIYHVHSSSTGAGQIVDIEFEGTVASSTNRRVSVEMYLGAFGSNNNVSYIEELNPVINFNLNPELVVKARNTPFSDSEWFQSQTITPSSSFELAANGNFFINLYSSKETRKYMVAVRQNSSGITTSREYNFMSLTGNPFSSNQDISNIFAYPYFPKNYIRHSYTVFIHGLDCQGNIVSTKNFEVFYTGIKLFEEGPMNYRD